MNVSISFNPIRLVSFMHDSTIARIRYKNPSRDMVWVEFEVTMPTDLSFDRRQPISKAKIKGGIVLPGETKDKEVVIYSSTLTHPGDHNIRINYEVYDRNGKHILSDSEIATLRVVRVGEKE